ncbi:MAG: carboxypeptidase-like regulatory domain-containing protein, partial [Bacteroides sp.]
MKNNLSLKIALLFIVTLVGADRMLAQEIRGKLVDTELVPIGSATLVLQTTDSTFVDAVVSQEDGTFFFPSGSAPFILTVQHIAYKTLQQTFQDGDVGVIKMTAKDT